MVWCSPDKCQCSSLTQVNKQSVQLSRKDPGRSLVRLIQDNFRGHSQRIAHPQTCMLRQCRSSCSELKTPIVAIHLHALRSSLAFPVTSRDDPSSFVIDPHQSTLHLTARRSLQRSTSVSLTIPHSQTAFCPAVSTTAPLPRVSLKFQCKRMEMTDKHVFVQTQIDKGSSLEPQVMTCQQHECVCEHRQEENTKTSTTHSHVSKKHCTGTGRILRSHLKRTIQAGFHILLIQQLGCTVCCHVQVLRNLQTQLAHTAVPK